MQIPNFRKICKFLENNDFIREIDSEELVRYKTSNMLQIEKSEQRIPLRLFIVKDEKYIYYNDIMNTTIKTIADKFFMSDINKAVQEIERIEI